MPRLTLHASLLRLQSAADALAVPADRRPEQVRALDKLMADVGRLNDAVRSGRIDVEEYVRTCNEVTQCAAKGRDRCLTVTF